MKTALADRYIRSDDFADRIDGVEFAPEVWAIFAQLHQARSAAELAATLKLDVKEVQAALRRLVRRKLIRKHVLGWRDYAATASPVQSNTDIPVCAPVASAPTPATELPSVPPAPVAAATPVLSVTVTETPKRTAPGVFLRLAPEHPHTPPAPPLISLRLTRQGSVSAPSAAPASRWRLRPIIDAISARAGGGIPGQLLVYRVFLQIPPSLLQAAGLHSLSLVDDHFTVNHAPLRAAILDAARVHASVELAPLLAA
ncbi:MAG: hypothetical protein RIQ79_1364 [Verrucomicrobiota bacterium]